MSAENLTTERFWDLERRLNEETRRLRVLHNPNCRCIETRNEDDCNCIGLTYWASS